MLARALGSILTTTTTKRRQSPETARRMRIRCTGFMGLPSLGEATGGSGRGQDKAEENKEPLAAFLEQEVACAGAQHQEARLCHQPTMLGSSCLKLAMGWRRTTCASSQD